MIREKVNNDGCYVYTITMDKNFRMNFPDYLLKEICEEAQSLLEKRGYLFIRDVLEMMEIPITKSSLTHGWTRSQVVKIGISTDLNFFNSAYELHFNIGPKDDLSEWFA